MSTYGKTVRTLSNTVYAYAISQLSLKGGNRVAIAWIWNDCMA